MERVNTAGHWAKVFRTPNPEQTAAITLLAMWVIAALWGWFFVDPFVLRESQVARDFVDFAVIVFPWIGNIKTLGPRADQGLFLHSVYFFALAPGTVACNLVMVSRPGIAKLASNDSPAQMAIEVCFCFALTGLVVWGMYYGILKPSHGVLHRTGYSFAISQLMVPVVAPFFIMGFWCALSCGFYFAYDSARKLISRH
jgi:hypothetical protein